MQAVRPDCFLRFGQFLQRNSAYYHKNVAKVGLNLCQILNYPSNRFQRLIFCTKWWNFAKSGHTGFKSHYHVLSNQIFSRYSLKHFCDERSFWRANCPYPPAAAKRFIQILLQGHRRRRRRRLVSATFFPNDLTFLKEK